MTDYEAEVYLQAQNIPAGGELVFKGTWSGTHTSQRHFVGKKLIAYVDAKHLEQLEVTSLTVNDLPYTRLEAPVPLSYVTDRDLNVLLQPGDTFGIGIGSKADVPLQLAFKLIGLFGVFERLPEPEPVRTQWPGVDLRSFLGDGYSKAGTAQEIKAEVIGLVGDVLEFARRSVAIVRERLEPLPPERSKREHVMGLALYDLEGEWREIEVLEPGKRAALWGEPQVIFRPEVLRIDAEEQNTLGEGWFSSMTGLNGLRIDDLKVGRNSQFISSTPTQARFFGKDSCKHLKLDVCTPGMQFVVALTNTGLKAVKIFAEVSGETVD